MLDELKEYQLYTYDPKDPYFEEDNRRLRNKTFLRNDFSGVGRAMEILARHCLFSSDSEQQPDDWCGTERMAMTERVLRGWCGFYKEAERHRIPTEYLSLDHWIQNYISEMEKGREKALLEKWDRKKNYYGAKISSISKQKNDENRISYQRTIANALREGPLKRRYLIGKLDPEETIENRTDIGRQRKFDRRSVPVVLGLTAMYCLQRERCNENDKRYVIINLERLADWLCKDSEIQRNSLTDKWHYRGEPLFSVLEYGRNIRYAMNRRWLEDGGWQLIDATDGDSTLDEFLAVHKGEGYSYYKDGLIDSSNKNILIKNERY